LHIHDAPGLYIVDLLFATTPSSNAFASPLQPALNYQFTLLQLKSWSNGDFKFHVTAQ